MRILVWPVLTAALVFGGISGAHAQQDASHLGEDTEHTASQPQGENAPSENTGEPPAQTSAAPPAQESAPPPAQESAPPPAMTAQQCSAAYKETTQKLFACMASVREQLDAELKAIAQEITQQILKGEVTAGAVIAAWTLEGISEDINVAAPWIKNIMRACVAAFDSKYRDLKVSCGASLPSYCAARNAVASTCASYCIGSSECSDQCGRWVGSPGMCSGPKAKLRVNCGYLPVEMMAACYAHLRQPRSATAAPDPASRSLHDNAKLKPAESKSTASAKATSSTTKPAKKNNLDRFDLGPTFVSPDASGPGAKTTARRTTTSKTGLKATTSPDAVTVAPQVGGASATAPKYVPK